MTESDKLQRRYRRLLALYPQAFRERHEQEMLGVLMDGARSDARRSRVRETLNVMAGAVVLRIRHFRIPREWEQAHARVMFPVRIALGTWLTFLSIVLIGYSSAPLWALLTGPFALLHFTFAYLLRRDRTAHA